MKVPEAGPSAATPSVPSCEFRGVETKNYLSPRNDQVLRWVPNDAQRVLDLGCGSGENARALAGQGMTVDATTLSLAEAAAVSSFCRRVVVQDLELGLPPELSDSYDAILLSHVLEHLRFPSKLLTDVRARLAPEGRLIVAIPNLFFFRTRLDLLRGRFEYTDGGIMDNTHFRWYTLQTLVPLLVSHDFDVEAAYGDGNAPLGRVRRLFPVLCGRIDRAACARLPGLFGWQLLAVARLPRLPGRS